MDKKKYEYKIGLAKIGCTFESRVEHGGFESHTEYRKYLAKQKDLEPVSKYNTHLEKGLESYTEHLKDKAKENGFESYTEYQKHLAKKY